MNENDRHEAFEATAQGELYREVVDIYAEPENFPREEASPFAERILQLIDKAVAARDAEIREALVYGGPAADRAYEHMADQYERNGKMDRQCAIAAVLGALEGLAEEEAER